MMMTALRLVDKVNKQEASMKYKFKIDKVEKDDSQEVEVSCHVDRFNNDALICIKDRNGRYVIIARIDTTTGGVRTTVDNISELL